MTEGPRDDEVILLTREMIEKVLVEILHHKPFSACWSMDEVVERFYELCEGAA